MVLVLFLALADRVRFFPLVFNSLDWDNDTKGGVTGGAIFLQPDFFAGNPPGSITQSGKPVQSTEHASPTADDLRLPECGAQFNGDDNPTFTAVCFQASSKRANRGSGAVQPERGIITTIASLHSDVRQLMANHSAQVRWVRPGK